MCLHPHIAADDERSQGLTPDIFWKHKVEILATDRVWLRDMVQELVAEHTGPAGAQYSSLPTPIAKVRGRLLVGAISDLPQPRPHRLPNAQADVAYVLISEQPAPEVPSDTETPSPKTVFHLQLPQGKRGQKQFLEEVLPQATLFVDTHLSQGSSVCICCDTGKDASVGVALAALQLFFDEDGDFVETGRRASRGVYCHYLYALDLTPVYHGSS